MEMRKDNSFTEWIISLPIIAILLTASILTYEFVSYEKESFMKEVENLEDKYITNLKDRIENRINRTIDLIETNIELSQKQEKEKIKDIVNIAYNTIKETYQRNKNLPKQRIIQEIRKRLENQKFYTNQSGYYFMVDLEHNVLMNPQAPHHVGKNLANLQDKNGKFFIKEFSRIAKTKKEGFSIWSWKKPKEEKSKKKLGFIKAFEPLGLYVGSARYVEDINKDIALQIIKIISSIKYGPDEYIFAMTDKGITLSHINKSFVGKQLETLSKVEQAIIQNILDTASKKEGGFIGYTPTSHNLGTKLSRKISFVKKVPTLNWVIGTGQYTTKLKKQIIKKKTHLEQELKEATNKIIIISISISLVLILVLSYIARHLEIKFRKFEYEVERKNKKLNDLNESLEKRVQLQVEKNRKKEELLHHQSKLASMGEMLGNIAHQWRQPLSTISTAASGVKLHDEMGSLEKKFMHYSLDTIVDNTKILSQTIDDFRSFFREDKVEIEFNIKDSVKKVLTLVDPSLKHSDIKVVQKQTDDCIIKGLENELIQVLLNILNNAKDAVIHSKQKKKLIFISTIDSNKETIIKIWDNGEGIKKDILPKIFEPYFTTKFKAQGTGIGLYMSRTIIVDHMNGKLSAKNVNFNHEGIEYTGACFNIVIKKK